MVYIMDITKIMMVLVVKKQYYGFSELDKSSRLRIGNFIMKVRRIRTALSVGHHPSTLMRLKKRENCTGF